MQQKKLQSTSFWQEVDFFPQGMLIEGTFFINSNSCNNGALIPNWCYLLGKTQTWIMQNVYCYLITPSCFVMQTISKWLCLEKIILTRAGYTCTAFRCTTPVHLYYTCFTPPNSYQFFGLGRKYHLLFDLVRQFPCLRLKITTWWYNIEVLDYIFFFFVVNFYNSGYHKH